MLIACPCNGNTKIAPILFPDSKVHGANMGPIWGRQDPGGPHVGPMNFAIWVHNYHSTAIHMVWLKVHNCLCSINEIIGIITKY